ncbi:hypothetical protein [Marinitenerispora sediminis]|uniref:Uncharacterized protein n=1 Tax=Marinitenerispora sediminis TaxID=1931232 RepID=A0A368T9H7_9ACTN|nr:hypothetical protein [Marinitenerispora sediminis]RCV52369.1 hypothetical protein DEF28_13165 [Marinitenerispora sediminis]RCV60934.1 hypothetical protein DEF24_05575 [Marinitenerispora sediminis]RCV62225.1 hypothetical protein DEF23_00535 [Marinitenerispora sediminis]
MNAWRDRRGADDAPIGYHTVIHNSGSGNQFVVGDRGAARQAAGPPGGELGALVERLWDALPDLGLDHVDQADYVAAVSHVEEEVTRDRPRTGRLGRALGTASAFLRARPVESARLALEAATAIGRLYGLAAPG